MKQNVILEKEEEQENNKIINKLNDKLTEIDDELNQKVLCKSCKGKKIEKLADKCGNEEMAKLLYEHKLNANQYYNYVEWVPFNEFINVEYLAKGGFGEVHKATWIDSSRNTEVVLKRMYNSDNKIIDILKEVKKKSLTLILYLLFIYY